MSNRLTTSIQDLMLRRDYMGIKKLLEETHPSDIARVLKDLQPDTAGFVFRILPKDLAIDVFDFMNIDGKQMILHSLSSDMISTILNEMSQDDRTELFEELPAKVVKKYLSLLSEKERRVANMLLGYPEDSAGRLMTTAFVDLKEHQTVDEALAHVRATAPDKETIYHLYVISKYRKLMGGLSLRELILAPGSKSIHEIMNPGIKSVSTDTDQEDVARIFEDYDLMVLPVVDKEERLVGIITYDDVFDIVREEDTEDIHLMGGLGAPEETYFSLSIFEDVKRRGGWLALLILLESFSGNILEAYSSSLETVIALAFFIPMLIDTGGNAGTQSSTLITRGLATGEISRKHGKTIFFREMITGAVLGLGLGAFAYVRAYFMQRDPMIGFAVGISLFVVLMVANLVGALLPLLAVRIKYDPAVMAGPFLTTIVDVVGLIVYFEVAKAIMGLG
ncbi:MAG: magnesium transporter [Firmicutes bacterium]|nr:magnesium transporter [Bacillota bacterium]